MLIYIHFVLCVSPLLVTNTKYGRANRTKKIMKDNTVSSSPLPNFVQRSIDKVPSLYEGKAVVILVGEEQTVLENQK